MSLAKPVDKLTAKDWEKHPVWTFDSDNDGKAGRDETWMVPVKKLPVSELSNRGCIANARLASGKEITAIVWNVDLTDFRRTDQFIGLSVWINEKWQYLQRSPFGHIPASSSPNSLAKKLRLDLSEVFPIAYDISKYATGPEKITKGLIATEPHEKLTRAELIALAVP